MKYIYEVKQQKTNTINIILYSVILGVIINVISNALGIIFNLNPWIYVTSGIIIALVLIVVTLIHNINKLNQTTENKGAFIIDKQSNNKLITIPDYNISEDMVNNLNAAFVENAAIEKMWQNGSFNVFEFVGVNKEKRIIAKASETSIILIELIEYSILNDFSVFIGDYFNQRHLNNNVINLDQKSIPDILLENRFLKLFSEDPNNRMSFVNDDSENDYENVVESYQNGAIFRRFQLNLPKGSKVFRLDKNTISIDTKLFTLTIKILFGGFNTFIQKEFFDYYLHKKKNDCTEFEFNVEIKVKYKLHSIFKIMDWKYYNWLDEYIERLSHYCDIDTFYNDINWKQNKTIIRLLKSIESK